MDRDQVARLERRYGLAGARALMAKEKRVARYRERLKTGKPLLTGRGNQRGMAIHPADCPCYDCLWGDIAEAKRPAVKPQQDQAIDCDYHCHGRMRPSRSKIEAA